LRNNPPNEAGKNSNAGRPSMCRSCGAIIGGGQPQCAVCGASVTGPATDPGQPRVAADGETMRFARAVLSRPYKFTIILLMANFFVFLLMWEASGTTGGSLWGFPEPVLVAFGAKVNFLINQQHQWWRFVTPMFVHVNLLHVLVNMYSLWIVGPYVEKLYGSAKFIVFWVLTGVAGVLASYLTVRPGLSVGSMGRFLFKTADVPSAGASGALFGLVGVLFVFGIKFRHELPEGFKRAFGTGLLPMIMLNLFIGYVGRGFIDNAAHLGGMISGGILAVAVGYQRPGEKSGITTLWQVLQIAAIALVAISFIKTGQHYGDPLPPPLVAVQPVQSVNPKNDKFVSYAKAMNDAQEAFYLVVNDGDVASAERAVKDLQAAPQLDATADELKNRLQALLIKAREMKAAQNSGTPDIKNPQPGRDLTTSFVAWSRDYNAWLKTSGRKYSSLTKLAGSESPPK